MVLIKASAAVLSGLSGWTLYRYQRILQREQQLPTKNLDVFDESGKSYGRKQRVLVIGAGVVGVTTAYQLAKQGHQVVILEPREEPGEECSACAAGGMQRSNPVIDRDSWLAVLKCIAPDPLVQLAFGKAAVEPFAFFQMGWSECLSDPFFLRWVATFTHTSLFPDSHQEERQVQMLDFTKYAVEEMTDMIEGDNYWKNNIKTKSGYNSRGSLSVSYDIVDPTASTDSNIKKSNESAVAGGKRNYEPSRKLTTTQQVLEEEPSLKFQERPPTSAKYEFEAKSASSGRFAKELARRCVVEPKLDVEFMYGTKVCGIRTCTSEASTNNKQRQRISQLLTNRGVISIPDDVKVVVAAGAWTPHVLSMMDLYAPVYPLKGYSMSASAEDTLRSNPSLKPKDLPSRIVSDKYMYTTRLGDEIRITSIGEFSGWATTPTPEVDENFRHEAKRQFPQLSASIEQARTYCGHRPLVSDGILLLGALDDTHENLLVSVGPGSNGWKLAMGSGTVMERLVVGQPLEQIQAELGFDAKVFSPNGRVLSTPLFARLCRVRWDI